MAKRTRKNAADDLDTLTVVNPSDADDGDLFLMWFGAYRDSRVLVWAGSFDDAFEIAVDHFDDPKSCGVFTFTEESDYKAAAEDEGIEWPAGGWDDLSDRDQEKVREAAEADLTTIGHTTLSCMPKKAWGAFVASYEWGGDEITGDDKKRLRAVSLSMNDEEDLKKMGWTRKSGEDGAWTAPLDADKDDVSYDAELYDQRLTYNALGGDGRKVLVKIWKSGSTAPMEKKTFNSVQDANDWVSELEDELKWAEE